MKVTSKRRMETRSEATEGVGESFPIAIQGLSRSDWD